MTSRATADPPTFRVHGPADLLGLVPYLLGFHPARSLVLLALRAGRVVVTARIDLTDLLDPAHLAVRHTVTAMAHSAATSVIGVVYDESAHAEAARGTRPLPWSGVPEIVAQEAAACGVRVDDTLLVGRRRWWSYTCTQACCPAQGTPLADRSAEVQAAATYAGLVALPDRAALLAQLEPDPDETLQPLLAGAERSLQAGGQRAERGAKRALFAAARRLDEPGAVAEPPPDHLASFGAALTRLTVRDPVWLGIDDGRLDGRALWRLLGRRLPGAYAAAPLFLYGWAAWRTGNGVLAGLAAERALRLDPGYTAADLLLGAIHQGLDPRRVPKLRPRSA